MKIFKKSTIYEGLCNGIVKIINNPNDDCIACQIGEFWFYFIGSEYENLKVTELYESFSNDELSEMICNTLNDMAENDFDEVEYYKTILQEYHEKTGLQQFAEMTIGAKESFCFTKNKYQSYACLPFQCGKVTYIYGQRSNNPDFWKSPMDRLKLWAAVKENQIYLINWPDWDIVDSDRHPSNVINIKDYLKVWQNRQDEITERYMEEITEDISSIILSDNDRKVCQQRARHYLLYKEPVQDSDLIFSLSKLEVQDCLEHLAGFKDLEEEMIQEAKKNREALRHRFAMNEKTREHMSEQTDVDDWELLLANACYDKSSVTVTFKKNGHVAEGKIKTDSLLRSLETKSAISRFAFPSLTKANEIFARLLIDVFAAMGISTNGELLCEDIVSISYRNKLIYQKKNYDE